MNILVVGSGGREHALVWKLSQSPRKPKIYTLPGSPGIAQVAECIAGDPLDAEATVALCKTKSIDLVVVGPEAPLAAGLSDALQQAGIKVFGPGKQGAQLESSKAFSKDFMRRHSIPTARYETYDDPAKALEAVAALPLPIVVKADGLAAGKGVRVCRSRREATQAIQDFMITKRLGQSGLKVVLEEFLSGPEVTIMAFCDGQSVLPLPASRDYKRLLPGNEGPNTGGMGAFAPVPISIETRHHIRAEILDRTLCALQAEDIDYCGLLYCGIILTKDGPKLLEYNARFGDPETQVVLPLIENDLLDLIEAAIDRKLAYTRLKTHPFFAATVVLASEGYPDAPQTGREIHGISDLHRAPDTFLFHAGTRQDPDGRWKTSGGRVLNVTSWAKTLDDAAAGAYRAAKKISFDGMQFRSDITLDASRNTPDAEDTKEFEESAGQRRPS